VQRRLTRLAQDTPRLPRGGPERAQRTNAVARQIPMRRIAWDEPEPGHFEVDLVHHGGPEPVGEYADAWQLVDVATGGSERVAVLGRSQRRMEEGFRRVLARLPFAVRELHLDNGSAFLNDYLVRAYLGHVRLDTATPVAALNGRYDDLWRYSTGFQPVLHLVAKAGDPTTPTRLRRR
jgi:hypothetical protein